MIRSCFCLLFAKQEDVAVKVLGVSVRLTQVPGLAESDLFDQVVPELFWAEFYLIVCLFHLLIVVHRDQKKILATAFFSSKRYKGI